MTENTYKEFIPPFVINVDWSRVNSEKEISINGFKNIETDEVYSKNGQIVKLLNVQAEEINRLSKENEQLKQQVDE